MRTIDTSLRIGIPIWARDLEFSYKNYFNTMRWMGANPVVIGIDDDPDNYDGLLLPGGYDVDPGRYGEVDKGCWGVDPAFDELQFTVLDHFVKANKPVFGICRGHQIINCYFGGSLIQHLPTTELHHREEGEPDRVNMCQAEPDSVLYHIYGERFPVNSNHHQAIDRLGRDMRITLYSDDGVAEAAECIGRPILSVQFHPERMCFLHARQDTVNGRKILQYFLNICSNQ